MSQKYLAKCFRDYITDPELEKHIKIKTGFVYKSTLKTYHASEIRPIIEENISADIFLNSALAQISDTEFLVSGGGPNSSATNIAKILRLDKYSVEKIKPMIIPRKSHSLGVILTYNTFVYAVGGYNKYGFLNSCEVYDKLKNKWRRSANLNNSETIRCVITIQNRFLYVCSGLGLSKEDYNKKNYKTIEKLDVIAEEDGWKQIILDSNEGLNYVLWSQEDFNLTAAAFQLVNPEEIIIFRSNALLWNLRTNELRYKEILGVNDELGPPVLASGGYIYFTHNSNFFKYVYSNFTRAYAKLAINN